jgi:hypothetical protein
MPRTATTEALARALHVGPAAVRKYARQGRVPFDQTPGGHRRFDIEEAVAALAGDRDEREPETPSSDEVVSASTYVRVQPEVSVTVTCSTAVLGDAPVHAYDRADDREAWAAETTVV